MSPALHFKQFGKYEIIRKLGRSMTDVYLALDPEMKRRLVLKIIEHANDPLTQLIIEAEKRGAAIQHQLHALDVRILEIYDFGEQNGCFFVAMEYVEGKSLADILRAEHRLDGRRAVRYAIDACSQLQTLHSFQADIDGRKRAVVHGDIKPSNIQIGPGGEVRLLDFGIAKAITSTHNLTHHNLGSPAYCSPERVKTSHVDQHADLWALGVSLYEMVAGMPPYQAQDTRKLENLIQSRRPPRALPENCPAPLRAIITKALAADMDRRYASAAAFENDLRLFLQNRPTAAEMETQPAWNSNATLDKAPPVPTVPRIPKQKLVKWVGEANRIVWAGLAGLVAGLLLLAPAGYAYRVWTQSAFLRGPRDYIRAGTAQIESDWRTYLSVVQRGRMLGPLSPAAATRQALRANLVSTATGIIERYRNSSDPALERFDWAKAQMCLKHALELEPEQELHGKLALVSGYLQLTAGAGALSSPAPIKSSFDEASAYAPRLPDPHLALARLYIYAFHNVGSALAEFHEAERLGFRPGPREFEQQADGYLYRAEQELKQWRNAAKAAKAVQTHYLLLAQRDLERARNLYEPITGFSKVSENLEQLYRDESEEAQIQAARERPRAHARPRYRYTRQHRWQ